MDWLLMIAVFVSFLIKGMCGFANTMVFNSIMSFKAMTVNISPLEVLIGYPSNLIILIKNKEHISIKNCALISCIVLTGSVVGTFCLKSFDASVLKIFFGLTIVAIAIEMLLREIQKKKQKSSTIVLLIIGLCSGVLSGLFGVGALLAAYFSRTTDNNNSFKGNLCVVFFIENTFRIILYIVTGILSFKILKQALFMLPIMIVALLLGILLADHVNEKIMKHIVIFLLILSGISLIISNLR